MRLGRPSASVQPVSLPSCHRVSPPGPPIHRRPGGPRFDNHPHVVGRQAVARREQRRCAVLMAHEAMLRPEPDRAGPVLMDRPDHRARGNDVGRRRPRTGRSGTSAGPRVGRDPQAPVPVLVEGGQAARRQTILDGVVRERPIPEPAQPAGPRANPDGAAAVLDDGVDVARHEPVGLRIRGDDFLPDAVQAGAVRPQPEVAVAILTHRAEGHRLAASGRRERQGAVQDRTQIDRPRSSGWQAPRHPQRRLARRSPHAGADRLRDAEPGMNLRLDPGDASVGGRGPERPVLFLGQVYRVADHGLRHRMQLEGPADEPAQPLRCHRPEAAALAPRHDAVAP